MQRTRSLSAPTLQVCHVIHSLGAGGAERALVELSQSARAAGLAMSVLSLTRSADDRCSRHLIAAGARVVQLDLAGRWDPRGLGRAVEVVRTLRPDVVHTHLKHADLVGAHVSRRLGVPMVSTLHLIEDAPGLVGRGKRWAGVRSRERSAARTIAVSDALRRWYVGSFRVDPRRVVTVHNGVAAHPPATAQERAEVRGDLGAGPDAFVLAMVGIMRPGKGHQELIAAAGRLPQGSRAHLVLVGDGPLSGQLRSAARSLTCPVTFTGYREDVSRLLGGCDLVVHPTRFDALPTALIEALAAGRPVLASDVGGVPEIVTPDVGRRVPPGDVAALAQAITDLEADPEQRKRFGVAARARFEQEFEAGRWARRLRALYDHVLDGATTREAPVP
ncbi:MAG TPA: glycosyltransferase [Actinomycetales bacterium]|nr:glycosyltransferase [Actinomycetales bacterium]